jgi:hypothetical protein
VIGEEGSRARGELVAALKRSGFDAAAMTPETAAAEHGVEGVPLLEISAPDGSVRFRGGYRDRNTPPGQYLDVTILEGLIASRLAPQLQVYGCATSRRLKLYLDPFSWKAYGAR